MKEDQVLDVLEKVGAFRAGHIVLTSGRHSDSYINKDALFAYPKETSELCKEFARRLKGKGVDAIAGPAVAAAILAQWTAYHLGEMEGRNVYATYADKDGDGGFVIKRGYNQLLKGKKVFVVEDLTTTGGSVKKVVDAVREVGGTVIGAGVLCNRGDITAKDLDVPLFESLVTVELESWDENDCDLCKSNIPVNTDIGHGKQFLTKK